MKKSLLSLISGLGIYAAASFNTAMAAEPFGPNLQPPASPSAEEIHKFHDMMIWIIAGICAFVLLLLIIVVLRYNRYANKEPTKTTHNVLLEVLWTVVPVAILFFIAIPSFKLLYYTDRVEVADMTLEVTGRQWYWEYKYPDQGDITFSAYMLPEDQIDSSKGQLRLLSTDAPVVLPVNKNIRILAFGGDVIHAFAVPALGVKIDTVPGQTNETWVRITKPGIYFGQCSELCGKDHAYMPIEIHAVSEEEFNAWVANAQEEFSSNEDYINTPTRLAALEE